jgi:hypothetical protein
MDFVQVHELFSVLQKVLLVSASHVVVDEVVPVPPVQFAKTVDPEKLAFIAPIP